MHLATSLVRLDTARCIEGLLKLEGVADEPAVTVCSNHGWAMPASTETRTGASGPSGSTEAR